MTFNTIPLNIKRFYFTNDPLGCVERKKIKSYYDKDGHIVYSEELFDFNNLYVEEGMTYDETKNVGFTTGHYGNSLVLIYQHLPMSDDDDYYKHIEEYPDYIKLDCKDGLCEYNGQIYTDTIYLDKDGNFLCSLGYHITEFGKECTRIGEQPFLLHNDTKWSSVNYTVVQVKNGKEQKFTEYNSKLYLQTGRPFTYFYGHGYDKDFQVYSQEEITGIRRTIYKDTVTIDYYIDDKIVATEKFYIDDKNTLINTIKVTKTTNYNKDFLNHTLKLVKTRNEYGEFRTLWVEDLGEDKTEEKGDDNNEKKN